MEFYTAHGILQARILEWVAFPVSRGSSQPSDRTEVSHKAGGFFPSWSQRKAPKVTKHIRNFQTLSFSKKCFQKCYKIFQDVQEESRYLVFLVKCTLVNMYAKWNEVAHRVQLFANPWTIAYQAPPSMEFSRQEYWSGLPLSSPGDLPTQGSNPGLPHCRLTLLPSEPPGKQPK